MIEADQVIPFLWQGSRPPMGSKVREAGMHLLILCAEEYQPEASEFLGVDVVHAPNIDESGVAPTRDQLANAIRAADIAVSYIRAKRPVLVTCWMGINRSGLVTALTLHKLLGISGIEACGLVRKARPIALTNRQFLACLERLPQIR
jgi:protein-tyrosine phosphatase